MSNARYRVGLIFLFAQAFFVGWNAGWQVYYLIAGPITGFVVITLLSIIALRVWLMVAADVIPEWRRRAWKKRANR